MQRPKERLNRCRWEEKGRQIIRDLIVFWQEKLWHVDEKQRNHEVSGG